MSISCITQIFLVSLINDLNVTVSELSGVEVDSFLSEACSLNPFHHMVFQFLCLCCSCACERNSSYFVVISV